MSQSNSSTIDPDLPPNINDKDDDQLLNNLVYYFSFLFVFMFAYLYTAQWVPASSHPELNNSQDLSNLVNSSSNHSQSSQHNNLNRIRSNSSRNSSLSRRKSKLSRQYNPTEDDDVEVVQHSPSNHLSKSNSLSLVCELILNIYLLLF